jgi:two-component system cell cycle sensor histidine kinase/response regulator CckA
MQKGRKTVLVVDDEPSLLEFIKNVLSPKKYRLLFAETGEEAQELLNDEANIDLMITDIMLPELKGHELAKYARKKRPQLKIMYMSGIMCPSIPGEDSSNLDKYFLMKPFTPSRLKKIIREHLQEPAANSIPHP